MASAKARPSSKKAKSEQSVMGSNNSSIVSKRSVERLYYPEPHFFRYFVKKPQRRAPLINRGYWLRMHAIDAVVRQFLDETTSQKKLILNLGCGYDPLAFQWLSKIKGTPQHATFIDVDFPDLISQKSHIISATPEICDVLGQVHLSENSDGMCLRSDSYCTVGCDLADTRKLDRLLGSLVDLSEYQVLCTAEVSITYMEVGAADSLIAWVARQNDARFCLLEQYLPDGADHPFARKMLQHFNNLQIPLKNINTYPMLSDQARRFSRAGWAFVQSRSLWDLFRDTHIVSYEERKALDKVEPFDEWEELILFASHYFLLIAKHKSDDAPKQTAPTKYKQTPILMASANSERLVHSSTLSNPCPGKKFGTIFRKSFHDTHIHHIGGFGPHSRTATTNLYRIEDQPESDLRENLEHAQASGKGMFSLPSGCDPRMCSTNTALGFPQFDWLLVGGRKSPHQPLKDCWLLHDQRWHRVDDLPVPLYRHCSTNVKVGRDLSTTNPAVLVYGGRTSNNIVSNEWFLWRESASWETVTATVRLNPVFGAAMISCGDTRGILLGGMAENSVIHYGAYVWNLTHLDEDGWSIDITECIISTDGSDVRALQYLFRFGATIERTSRGFLLIGGVADKIIPSCYEVVEIFTARDDFSTTGPLELFVRPLTAKLPSPRPLLVGHSSLYHSGRAVVIGGGAVCFSFGTHWNTAPLIFCTQSSPPVHHRIVLIHPSETTESPILQVNSLSRQSVTNIGNDIAEEPFLLAMRNFQNVMTCGRPVVSRKLELGICVAEWQSLDTVKDRVGSDRDVVVHVCGHRHMDFRHKNFDYVKKSFGQFIEDFKVGHRQYLRSLSSQNPVEKPANFQTDFPRLAEDFDFLNRLSMLTNDIHSSVLRISGFVDMWLHYDVMANMLCQIRGSKRLILFPPSDVSHLSLPAGSSTSSVDCFNGADNLALAQTHPYFVTLHPGDVLYIPPLWLHAASATDTTPDDNSPVDGVSISINVFFRNLESGYAPGRDVYGNRDVQGYEKGRRDLEKITRAFDGLPPDMRRFYLDRLADELKEKACLSKQG